MAHQDTNDNEAYDFPASEGDDDGPYTADGDIVMDDGNVTVSAGVAFAGQSSDGTTVTVERVDLSEGGFVTVHDASLAAGETFDSVRGTSEYLAAGVHEDVTVELDEPLRETNQLLAMPHVDSDGDEMYDFVESEGGEDGPFLDDAGQIQTAGATASVTASVSAAGQETDGETIVVDEVTLHDGGFVTVHDSSLADGAVFDSIRGTSEYLAPGTHSNVEITLDEPLSEDDSVFAMAHQDANANEAYDFPATEGDEDGPYVAAGGPVMSLADATVTATDDGMDSDDETNGDDGMDSDDMDDDGTNDSTPGFGVIVALVALLAAALFAGRRR